MYAINSDLIIREDDLSLFSLENMEVYEFNEIGFKAIMLVENSRIFSFEEWKELVEKIEGIDIADLDEFWNALVLQKIIIPG